jgi:hypothetical protein
MAIGTWQPWISLDRDSTCNDWSNTFVPWAKPTLDEKVDFLDDLGFTVDEAEDLVPVVDSACKRRDAQELKVEVFLEAYTGR